MVTQIPIGDFVVRRERRLQGEAVQRLPFVPKEAFEDKSILDRHEAMWLMRRVLRDVRYQTKWTRENVSAESDVGDVGRPTQIDQ